MNNIDFMRLFFNKLFNKNNNSYKVKIINNFGFNKTIQLDYPLEVFIDVLPKKIKNTKRILLVLEPNEISGLRNDILNLESKTFDLILAHDPLILKHFPNSKKFLFGTTWVKGYKFQEKSFGVSSLIGGKTFTPLHKLRHRLIDLLDLTLEFKLYLFNSSNNSFSNNNNKLLKMNSNEDKNELFFCQFHIAIENVISDNWFTEKLIDCFQTKTVPIYLGCSNIGEYFDLNGMIIVNSYDDIVEALNRIQHDTYYKMQKHIEINYELSKKYLDFGTRLENEIRGLI